MITSSLSDIFNAETINNIELLIGTSHPNFIEIATDEFIKHQIIFSDHFPNNSFTRDELRKLVALYFGY